MIEKEKYCNKCKCFKDDKCTTTEQCFAEQLYNLSIAFLSMGGDYCDSVYALSQDLVGIFFETKKTHMLSVAMQATADYIKEHKLLEKMHDGK